jgi:hypothetical protein
VSSAAKTSGACCATWLNSAVVSSARSMRFAPRKAARSGGASSVSLGTPTSVAPESSAPQISKGAASNDRLDSCATRRAAPKST